MAGRVTLARSVLQSISFYAMHVLKFLKGVCKELKRYSCNFIWDHLQDQRRVHLVRWEEITKPCSVGSLGLKRLEQVNDAILVKVGWDYGPNLKRFGFEFFPLNIQIVWRTHLN